MSFLAGKPATSSSSNTNNKLLTGIYTPQAQTGVAANNVLAGALGVPGGDTAGATAGFNQYLANSGFNNVLQKLVGGIVGGNAAGGLLRSGATDTAILNKGTELNQQYYNNWLQNLLGETNAGNQAGGIIANTGQTSTSSGGKPGLFGTLGSIVGGIASIFPKG